MFDVRWRMPATTRPRSSCSPGRPAIHPGEPGGADVTRTSYPAATSPPVLPPLHANISPLEVCGLVVVPAAAEVRSVSSTIRMRREVDNLRMHEPLEIPESHPNQLGVGSGVEGDLLIFG
jgi:hypothetical protein